MIRPRHDRRAVVVVTAVLAVLSSACASAPEPQAPAAPPVPMPASAPSNPRELKARAAVADFRSQLQAALRSALEAGGPEPAIATCRDVAPALASSLSEAANLRIGRTSHRLRNPGNAPEAWVQPLLDSYVAGDATEPSRTIPLPDGALGYVEPIQVQAPCLPCHGDPALMPQGVKDRLAEAYPQDAATGFREGDFRGLFWVIVPPA